MAFFMASTPTSLVTAVKNPTITIFKINFLPSSSAKRVAGIEKDFTIVMFADVLRDPMTSKANYKLVFNSDGKTSAKTPPMFLEENEENMENDFSIFLERVRRKLSNG